MNKTVVYRSLEVSLYELHNTSRVSDVAHCSLPNRRNIYIHTHELTLESANINHWTCLCPPVKRWGGIY
jgi:hypothetical protein